MCTKSNHECNTISENAFVSIGSALPRHTHIYFALIPIKVEERQKLLEIDDPWERVKNIERLIADLANNT